MARALLGEHWYQLTLENRHLGYWHTRNYRDRSGNWVFESEQRFAMDAAEPVSTTSRRVFAANWPHPLLLAEHLQGRRNQSGGIRIETRESGYVAVRVPADGSTVRPLSWGYQLGDYLEFELWLDAEQPLSGAKKSVDTLDFERSARVPRSFEVVTKTAEGYVIENDAPYAATRIELDRDFVPRNLRISGLFDLTRTTRQAALAARSALQAASYYVPVDRRLHDHTSISQLVVAIEGVDDPAALFADAKPAEGRWLLTLNAPATVGGPVLPAHRADTVQIPSRHPAIVSLAAQALPASGTETEKAKALADFVHRFVTYRPGAPPRTVLELIVDPRGDCTEFADLLTTLARSQGIPATTIFGLAYTDAPSPAFAYHAWNELYVDGAWMAVDPTWGELRLDATHIALPADEAAALNLLTGTLPLSFSVVDVDYFKD